MRKLLHILILIMMTVFLMGTQVYDGGEKVGRTLGNLNTTIMDSDGDQAGVTNSNGLQVSSQGAGQLSFALSSVTNSSPKDFEDIFPDFVCQVTNRTGIANVVVELQGSISPDISNDLSWVALVNSSVVNATAAGTSNSSWHFQSLEALASSIRMKVLSGAGVANTATGLCKATGR